MSLKRKTELKIKPVKEIVYCHKKLNSGKTEEIYSAELLENISVLFSLNHSIKQIQSTLEIPAYLWNQWIARDYQGFKGFMANLKKEKIVDQAEENLEEMLLTSTETVRADMTKFTLETLGKDRGYSKKTEIEGGIGLKGIMEKEEVDTLLSALKAKLIAPLPVPGIPAIEGEISKK